MSGGSEILGAKKPYLASVPGEVNFLRRPSDEKFTDSLKNAREQIRIHDGMLFLLDNITIYAVGIATFYGLEYHDRH
jgi:hypothetical protein